jgi:hypothetical protein
VGGWELNEDFAKKFFLRHASGMPNLANVRGQSFLGMAKGVKISENILKCLSCFPTHLGEYATEYGIARDFRELKIS